MIIGIGIDLIEISRIKKAASNDLFAPKILNKAELNHYYSYSNNRKIEFLAGRFAAKEAFAKAFGYGIGKHFSWHDIEIIPNAKHTPTCKFSTKIKKYFLSKNLKCDISITHTKSLAQAIAIISNF